MLEQVTAMGYQGKRTAFEAYCRKLVIELGIAYTPRRNAAGAAVNPDLSLPPQHYVSSKDFQTVQRERHMHTCTFLYNICCYSPLSVSEK